MERRRGKEEHEIGEERNERGRGEREREGKL